MGRLGFLGSSSIRLLRTLIATFIVAGLAWAHEPIRYQLSFPAAQNHRIHVEATYPTEGKEHITLKMAVWTAYVVRDYANLVSDLQSPLPASMVSKNRWKIPTDGSPTVTIRYEVEANSMHVQDNYVNSHFALINGQPTFLTLADDLIRPHEVKIQLPSSWKQSITAMKQMGENHYIANDYEELVDSPIVAGNPAIYTFEAEGKNHYLVNLPGSDKWDVQQSTRDLSRIITAQKKIWGRLPIHEYRFLNILSNKSGGMEHMESTVMMTSPNATRRRETYIRWLSLASHEYFHLWNVKRLRPREITPGEYEVEHYTPSLGIAEGFTSYYALLTMRRAEVINDREFFEELSRLSESLQSTEGRKVQTLADSSLEAWTKFYRPTQDSHRTTVNYYNKGALVAFLLDARIRKISGGTRSLDHVMREVWEKYPREKGYTFEEFQEIAGVDLKPWFYTTEELDYQEAEALYGLQISSSGRMKLLPETEARRSWLSGK